MECIPDRPVQSVDARIVANPPFKQLSVMTENIGLGNVCVAKRIKNRLGESLLSIGYAVHILCAVTNDLVRKLSGAKGHSRMCPKHCAFGGLLQGRSHGGLRVRTALLSVARGASLWAYEAFPWQFLSWAKVGQAACVASFCLRVRWTGKKQCARGSRAKGKPKGN